MDRKFHIIYHSHNGLYIVMIFKHVTFDQLISHPDVTYIPKTKTEKLKIEANGLNLQDTDDDVIILENALLVDRGGIVWKDNWISDTIHYMPPDWRDAHWLPGIYDKHTNTIDLYEDCLEKRGVIDWPVMLIDSFPANHNFGHFVHDTLPYGLLFKNTRKYEASVRPLLVPMNFKNQKELFSKVFEYQYENCTFSEPGFQIKKLYLGRRQTYMMSDIWSLSFSGLRHIREVAQREWSCPDVSNKHGNTRKAKIYLHRIQDNNELKNRGLLLGRNFVNFNEFLNNLLKEGFITFEPGLLDIQSIASIMSVAAKVVSVHGAGLANLIFAPTEAQIFEIRGQGGAWRSLEAVSMILGQHFNVINEIDENAFGEPILNLERILPLVS